MTGPLYHLYIVRGFREAYYQLSQDERDRFWTRVGENQKAAGCKSLLVCSSRWCNEATSAWGIEECPDLQAVQKMVSLNEENQHWRFMDAETYLGKEIDNFTAATVDFPDPLYQLWLVKNQSNEQWESLAKDTRERISAGVLDSIQKNGGKTIIGCDIDWSNEEFANFGVNAWPNLEAEQAHFRDMEKLGWHRYVYARTLLGTEIE